MKVIRFILKNNTACYKKFQTNYYANCIPYDFLEYNGNKHFRKNITWSQLTNTHNLTQFRNYFALSFIESRLQTHFHQK
jgi:hypothetical protein